MKTAINKTENVKEQYTNSDNLLTRIRIHKEYSTNKEGFVPFLFTQYQFKEGDFILELGCGTGMQWQKRIASLPIGCRLILSDFSSGMVRETEENYKQFSNVTVQQIDIQNIPYSDQSFDVVIANHMLYHVPDLEKALTEVKRVLKKGGSFYAATNGNAGLRGYLREAILNFNPNSKAYSNLYSFSAENALSLLKPYFQQVNKIDFIDSLKITKTNDLVNWIRSTTSISEIAEIDYEGLYEYFEKIRKEKGFILIPKQVVLFIATK